MKASSLESSAIYRCLLIRVTSERILFIHNIIDKNHTQVKVFVCFALGGRAAAAGELLTTGG